METAGPYKQSETVRNDDTGVAGDAGNVHMPCIDDVKEREMSTKCLTNDELEDLIAKFNTKNPQDRVVFYALIELRTYRSIESLENKKPLGEHKDSTKGTNKTSVTE